MRILFFHAYPHQLAGAQRLTQALALDLAERGHDVLVVCPDEGPFPDELRRGGITTRIVAAPSAWRRYGRALESSAALPALTSLPGYWRRLARAFRQVSPDLVHCNDHRGILLAGLPARLAGVPVVWHIHGAYRSRTIALFGGLCARRIVIVSEATRASQPGLRPFAEKIEIVHNGLITIPPDRVARQASPPAIECPVLVTGARLHPDKGLDVLLRAVCLLRDRYPRLRARIAGAVQPGYEQYAQELVLLRDALGLRDAVTFLGFVDDPAAAWSEATVYVQPSRQEPFGLAVLEASSVATPVVASRVGGIVEIVVDGETGLLVSPNSPAALAEAIATLVDDPRLARRLADAGRERVRDNFSREAMIERLLLIYGSPSPGLPDPSATPAGAHS